MDNTAEVTLTEEDIRRIVGQEVEPKLGDIQRQLQAIAQQFAALPGFVSKEDLRKALDDERKATESALSSERMATNKAIDSMIDRFEQMIAPRLEGIRRQLDGLAEASTARNTIVAGHGEEIKELRKKIDLYDDFVQDWDARAKDMFEYTLGDESTARPGKITLKAQLQGLTNSIDGLRNDVGESRREFGALQVQFEGVLKDIRTLNKQRDLLVAALISPFRLSWRFLKANWKTIAVAIAATGAGGAAFVELVRLILGG